MFKVNKKIKITLFILILVSLIYGSYEYYKYYQYAVNTYDFDISELEDLNNSKFTYLSSLNKNLIFTLEGKNKFKRPKDFTIEYFISNKKITNTSTETFFDIMSLESINNLSTEKITLNYRVVDYDFEGELVVYSVIDNIKFKPIYIDKKNSLDSYLKNNLTVYTTKKDFTFEIPLSDKLKKAINLVYDGKPYEKVYPGNAKVQLKILNSAYNVSDDFDFFNSIYVGGIEEKDFNYLNKIEEGFNKLPLKLKKHMFFNNLKIKGTDYTFLDSAYIEEQNNKYNEGYTLTNYPKRVGGTYDNSKKELLLNTTSNMLHNGYIIDFKKQYWEYELKDNYSIFKNGGKAIKVIKDLNTLKSYYEADFLNTLYHELGHYIDFNSDYILRLTSDEMLNNRNYYSYNYTKDLDYEHIAYAFSVYFENPNYLNDKLPKMYEGLEKLIEGLDYSVIEEYSLLLDEYENWSN